MAYAQLNSIKVRDAAEQALADVQARMSDGSATGQDRADLVRLQWLAQLAAASAQEDEAHRLVTVTAEDFNVIAKRYGVEKPISAG